LITKEIQAFGRPLVIACDGKCEKAFGRNGRPYIQLSEDKDDICWLHDGEVEVAPESGKTNVYSEGGHMKPSTPDEKLNKWCFRECERCVSVEPGEPIKLKDWSKRVYNQPHKHPQGLQ
jgi:hypothetical protein